MRVTARRVLIAATVAVIAAGVSVTAAIYHPTSGPIQVQEAAVFNSPTPLPGTPLTTPTDVPTTPTPAEPLPGTPIAATPSAPSVRPPAPASSSPAPLPRPQYCGVFEVLSPSTVTLAGPTQAYRCNYAELVSAGAIGPGSFAASGYIDLAGGRYFILQAGVLVRG